MTLLETRSDLVDGKGVRVAQLGNPKERSAPFVCLHGYPDNLQIFARLLPLLAPAREALAFDWPGLGDSETWRGGASPHQMADRIAALLDAWRIDKAVLIGLDMGGQPALVAAAKHPSRVERVVVMSSLVAHDLPTSWEIQLLRRTALNGTIIRHLPRAVFHRAETTFLGRGETLDADVRADLWRCFVRPAVREFVARMCAGYGASLPRLPAVFARVTAPVLALWPERDPHFPVAHARWLAETIPSARVEVLSGARHWMPFTRAPEVAAAILRFAGEVLR